MVKTAFFLGAIAASLQLAQAGWNPSCGNNMVVYHGNGGAPNAQSLKTYCSNMNSYVDVFILSFVDKRDGNGQPVFDSNDDSCDINGNCANTGSDVAYCQSLGKTVLISIGGGTGTIFFSSASDAQTFAQNIWNAYLGGSGSRPFGQGVIFDGVDLDVENNSPPYWGDFTTKLRALFATDTHGKSYLISSAPQPEPIESSEQPLVDFLLNAWLDIAFIQEYNNPGFDGADTLTYWKWWDSWARGTEANGNVSKNKNVKLVFGLPGANTPDCADDFQSVSTMSSNVAQMQSLYPLSFGGGGVWDDGWAYENVVNGQNFAQSFKSALGSCSVGPTTTSTVKSTTSTATTTKTSTATTTKTSTATTTKTTTTTTKTTATSTPTTGAICPNTGTSCPSWAQCCSQWGYCGSSSAYCGTGCVAAASFNGQCVGSGSAAVLDLVTPSNITKWGVGPPSHSVKLQGNFRIISRPGSASGSFDIRVYAGKNPITKNWSLTLPKGSGVVSSSRGTVRNSRTSIVITSKPAQEKQAAASIKFTVKASATLKQLDLSKAVFASQ